MPTPGRLLAMADMFAAFGDPTRLRLLLALARGEQCVADLAGVAGISASAASHQLRLLRSLRLVKFRREGKLVYYSLDDDHVLTLLDIGVAHVNEDRPEE